MKGKINKLAVFVIIATIAMFVGVGMTSAFGPPPFLKGKYAFTGLNPCTLGLEGFDSNFNPVGGPSNMLSFQDSWAGFFTFFGNGTGEVEATGHAYGPGSLNGSTLMTWKFNYSVAEGGKITFTMIKGTFDEHVLTGANAGFDGYVWSEDSWDGYVSPDRKTLLISWGVPLVMNLYDDLANTIPTQFIPGYNAQSICTGSFVGKWVGY
jgi:hypothetical protein